MNIIYTDKHNFNKNELEELFLSVGWSSGHYPEKLCVAMKNFVFFCKVLGKNNWKGVGGGGGCEGGLRLFAGNIC